MVTELAELRYRPRQVGVDRPGRFRRRSLCIGHGGVRLAHISTGGEKVERRIVTVDRRPTKRDQPLVKKFRQGNNDGNSSQQRR
jgi:hypothetical protein